MTTLYIAGPMRGIPEFNFPAFFVAEGRLERARFATINPARRDADAGFDPLLMDGTEDLSEYGFDLNEALAWDLEQIAMHADGIALLDGWEHSKGVAAEVATAKALGKPVQTVAEWLESRNPLKVGDRVRVLEGAYYTMDGDIHRVTPANVGQVGVIESGPDGEGDYDIKMDAGEYAYECANPDGLELIVPEPQPTVTVADIYATFDTADLTEHIEVLEQHVNELTGEVRVTSATGGQKGRKPAELATIDPLALMELAKVSGFGAQKYESFNYLKGYDWDLSHNALYRHYLAYLNGEDLDDESGLPHITHAAWHALALTSFLLRGIGNDNRVSVMLANHREGIANGGTAA